MMSGTRSVYFLYSTGSLTFDRATQYAGMGRLLRCDAPGPCAGRLPRRWCGLSKTPPRDTSPRRRKGVPMSRKIVDISVPLENDVAADPPGYGPAIEYLDHARTAADILKF